jgi:CRP-like cAMP-binding protein
MATPQHVKQNLFGTGVKRLELPTKKIVELADNTRWSDAFSLDEIEAMAEYMLVYQVDNNAVVVKEGSREAFLCILVKGKMGVFKESSDQSTRSINQIRTGKTFGEMSLIDGEPRSAAVAAIMPSTILVITQASFDKLIEEKPRLAIHLVMHIAKLTSQRLRQSSGMLVDALTK